MHRLLKLMMPIPMLCLCWAVASGDPIVITQGELSNTRTSTSLTIPGPGPLVVALWNDVPTWFGILNPGELVNLTAEVSVPYQNGTLWFEDTIHTAMPSAPILFEYMLRTANFPLVFGVGTPFAVAGSLTGPFGRIDVAGGGTISISEQALSFVFEPNPPEVPEPIPEPASLVLLVSGLVGIGARRRIKRSSVVAGPQLAFLSAASSEV